MLKIARKRGQLRPGYEKGPGKAQAKATKIYNVLTFGREMCNVHAQEQYISHPTEVYNLHNGRATLILSVCLATG